MFLLHWEQCNVEFVGGNGLRFGSICACFSLCVFEPYSCILFVFSLVCLFSLVACVFLFFLLCGCVSVSLHVLFLLVLTCFCVSIE